MLFFENQYRIFRNRSFRHFCRFVREVISWRSLEPFRYLLPGHLRMPPMQVIITEKCTLRCKKCAYLMNLYQQPQDVDDSVTMETLRKLQEYSDRIDDLIFVGGEPFCNPNLKYYLQAISPDICKKIEITTNGTVFPDDPELITAMKEKRVQVTFSNYGALSSKQEQAVKLLRDNDITCVVYSTNMPWYDFGTPEPRQADQRELDLQFSKCSCAEIFNVMNGIVDICPRSSHGGNLGLITVPEDERADVLHTDRKAFIKQMKKLMHRKKALTVCRYCAYMTDECRMIPRAEQEEKQGA